MTNVAHSISDLPSILCDLSNCHFTSSIAFRNFSCVMFFNIFFCLSCWVFIRNIKNPCTELSLSSIIIINYFFLYICYNYLKSSLIINMIFIDVCNLSISNSFLKIYFVHLALWYPIPSHFVVLSSYFDLLFYLICVLIKFLHSAMHLQRTCLLFWFWFLPDKIFHLSLPCMYFP